MELIRFDDYCTVLRDTGEQDEWNIPTAEEVVYSGQCKYQQGVQSTLTNAQRNSVLFLKGVALLDENDSVSVTLKSSGRTRSGVVKTVRDIEMPISHQKYTRIEIIHDTEKREG